MIATEHFVFLHLHKSGGTFVNEWLLRFFPGAQELGYHLPRAQIPRQLADLPVVGLIRNPWSYYVSWYTFQANRTKPNALFQILSDSGRLSFDGTIRNMLDLGSGAELLDRILAALPSTFSGSGLNLPGPRLAAIARTGLGFYSFLANYMYGSDERTMIARMENMREELPPMIASTGTIMSSQAAAFLATAAPRNTSAHRPYVEYYSPALRALVAERDATVIQQYGYRFEE